MKKEQLQIFFLSFIMFVGISSKAQDFKMIHCENQEGDTVDHELAFFYSGYGFITNSNSGSPLQEDIPSTVGLSPASQKESLSTLIIQEIQTEDLGRIILEEDFPIIYVLLIIIGGIVLGVFIASHYKKDVKWGAIIGGIMGLIIGLSLADSSGKKVNLTIDNATEMNLSIFLNQYPDTISLSAASQITLVISKGIHQITLLDNFSNDVISEQRINAINYKTQSGNTLYGYNVYNIESKNSYIIQHALYEKE